MIPRRACFRKSLSNAVYVVFGFSVITALLATYDPAWATRPLAQEREFAGTYRISICAGSCGDTSRADVVGYLVLSAKALSFASVPAKAQRRLENEFASVGRKSRPNACFTLAKRRGKSIAAARPVGFTNWVRTDSSSFELTLFRAPDSGYDLDLEHGAGAALRGVGRFWSGNGPSAQIGPDSVVAWRIGAADVKRCGEQFRVGGK